MTFYVIVLYGSHGLSRDALSAIREDFREFLGTALMGVILFSTLTGWIMARKALSGVVRLSRTAAAVAAGALERRVPVQGGHDEIDDLARAFNGMLDTIQLLVREMKETNDNIAHDLRSPVARMRSIAEGALSSATTSEDARILAGDIVQECDRLLVMVNTMLDISEASAGVGTLTMEEVDVAQIVQDAVDLFRPVADEKGVRLEALVPDALTLLADRRRLQRIVGNLADNALKFTPPGGEVFLSAVSDGDRVNIEVRDTGIGISGEELPRIFERFYRGERSRSEPGNGLGLSLARAFAISLGGSIRVETAPGAGSVFRVTLPARPSPGRIVER